MHAASFGTNGNTTHVESFFLTYRALISGNEKVAKYLDRAKKDILSANENNTDFGSKESKEEISVVSELLH